MARDSDALFVGAGATAKSKLKPDAAICAIRFSGEYRARRGCAGQCAVETNAIGAASSYAQSELLGGR